jgi:ribosomal protein S12 methylthiotransferase accessory factor YcaO
MKIQVSMKDPDALHEAVREAVNNEIDSMSGISADEKELIKEKRIEKTNEICRQWFEYGEYLLVEIDTESKTCIVLNRE